MLVSWWRFSLDKIHIPKVGCVNITDAVVLPCLSRVAKPNLPKSSRWNSTAIIMTDIGNTVWSFNSAFRCPLSRSFASNNSKLTVTKSRPKWSKKPAVQDSEIIAVKRKVKNSKVIIKRCAFNICKWIESSWFNYKINRDRSPRPSWSRIQRKTNNSID